MPTAKLLELEASGQDQMEVADQCQPETIQTGQWADKKSAKKCHPAEWTRQKESPATWLETGPHAPSADGIRKYMEPEVARLLKLKDDWDGEGSPRYSKDTIDRAVDFVVVQIQGLWGLGCLVPLPQLGPGPNGSIDLHWRQPTWELLVNIPADSGQPATFYGDDYSNQKIKGSVEGKNLNRGIAEWLLN